MKALLPLLFATIYSISGFSQTDTGTMQSKPVQPLLIKKQNNNQVHSEATKVVFKSNAGYVKIFKLTDSLYEFRAWENRIYLNRISIDELKEAAKILLTADKEDKVSLTTFRCEITKGKLLGADVYWVQLFKQKSMVDFSNISPTEIDALMKSSSVSSVKDHQGESVAMKAKFIHYEEMIKSFGIANKELKKIIEIE